MTIERLIAFAQPEKVYGPMAGVLHRLIDDSRIAGPNDAFIAVHGSEADGHAFIESALQAGVTVVVAERSPSDEELEILKNRSTEDKSSAESGESQGKGSDFHELFEILGITWLVCDDTREILAPLAFEFVGNPQQELKLIGVTGTNGKTTVTTLIWQVLDHLGVPAALLGTVLKRIGSHEISSKLTTPGAIELANDMKLAVESGCTHFIMEVSSHALEQGRTRGLDFDVAVFTNLTHDHLDYHKTLERYADAKKILFDELSADATAIVNADDPQATHMVKDCRATVWDLTLNSDDYYIHTMDQNGLLVCMDGIYLESPLTGKFNAYNIAQTFLALLATGVSARDAAKGLSKATGATGRLERILVDEGDQLPAVFVDYAHTPNALQNVLETLAEIRSDGQEIICVVGCGGNRDRTKRPVMAGISEKIADRTIVTSDNPRFEDPNVIITEICTGFTSGYPFEVEVDRAKAIRKAISSAPSNSLVLIAGKGHEPYQEIRGVRHHLDDRELVLEALETRKSLNHNPEGH